MAIEVSIVQLAADLPLPSYARQGDAGMDLYAAADLTIAPGERALVPTGIAIAIPEGYVGLIHPRSGLAIKHGVGMVNAPGTIDSGYRGEIQVILVNHDLHTEFAVKRGERIAQLVLQQIEQVQWASVDSLPESERGAGGFGSSGT